MQATARGSAQLTGAGRAGPGAAQVDKTGTGTGVQCSGS